MDWQKLVGTDTYVFHKEFMIAGRVEAYFDGVEKVFVGADGAPVKGKIVKLDNGHAVLADEKKFIELSEGESQAFVGMNEVLSATMASWIQQAGEGGLNKMAVFELILAVLTGHSNVVRGVLAELEKMKRAELEASRKVQLPNGMVAFDMSDDPKGAQRTINARHEFMVAYCTEKGWPTNPEDLSLEQIMEVRSQEGWKVP